MARDGSLRPIFRKHLPDAFWTTVETGSTGAGVPDAHYLFLGGAAGWIEFKLAAGNAVRVRPEQAAWLLRCSRLGGRCFVAVRTPDGLVVCAGSDAARLRAGGLRATEPLGSWTGGPSSWDWPEIRTILVRPLSSPRSA